MRPEDEYRLRKPLSSYSGSFTSAGYEVERKRSGCLTIWMVLYIISAVASICFLLTYIEPVTRNFSIFFTIILFALLAAEGIAAYFILQWKRWAVYLFIASLFISFGLKTVGRIGDVSDLISLVIALGLLAIFVRPQWDYYES